MARQKPINPISLKDIADQAAKECETSKIHAYEMAQAILKAVFEGLAEGRSVTLGNYGWLNPFTQQPRKRRNFITGERYMGDPSKTVRLRLAPTFKRRFNGKLAFHDPAYVKQAMPPKPIKADPALE